MLSATRGKAGYFRGIGFTARPVMLITTPTQNNRRLPRAKVMARSLRGQRPKAGFCRNRQFSGQRAGTPIRPHVRQFVLAFSPRMDDMHKKDLTGVRSGWAAQGTERLGMGRPYVPVVRDENPPKNPVYKASAGLESQTRRAGHPMISPSARCDGHVALTCTVRVAGRHESPKADSRLAVSQAKRPETQVSGSFNSVSTRYATTSLFDQKNDTEFPSRTNMFDLILTSSEISNWIDCSSSQSKLFCSIRKRLSCSLGNRTSSSDLVACQGSILLPAKG